MAKNPIKKKRSRPTTKLPKKPIGLGRPKKPIHAQLRKPKLDTFDKLLLLVGVLNGIDEVAEVLDVDEDLLLLVLERRRLTRSQESKIAGAIANFEADGEVQDSYSIDLTDLYGYDDNGNYVRDSIAEQLIKVRDNIGDVGLSNLFDSAYLRGDVQNDQLDIFEDLFGNLAASKGQRDKIIELLEGEVTRINRKGKARTKKINVAGEVAKMIKFRRDDIANDIPFWRMYGFEMEGEDTSEWWSWFREIFYPE